MISSDHPNHKPIPHFTGKECTSINIIVEVNVTKKVRFKLQIPTDAGSSNNKVTYLTATALRFIHISIKPCPAGFDHNNSICQCNNILKEQKHVVCKINNETIKIPSPAWIGYYNYNSTDDGIIYHKVCPYDYCLTDNAIVTSNGSFFDQDSQCESHRTGILCGKCKAGYSLSLLNSDCLKCTGKGRIALGLLYPLIGILMLILLVVFNITYTEGTLTGLLFYANVVKLNDFLQKIKPLWIPSYTS